MSSMLPTYMISKANALDLGVDSGGTDRLSRSALFADCLEGVAYVERWGYDELRALGAPVTGSVWTTGGATRGQLWLRIRAAVLGLPLVVPAEASSAFGASVIAAPAESGGVFAASRAMVRPSIVVEPDAASSVQYNALYHAFRHELIQRGLVDAQYMTQSGERSPPPESNR